MMSPSPNRPPKPVKPIQDDAQLAKLVYLRSMSSMKEILTLGEMRIGDRNSEVYKYFKKVVMDQFYGGMSDVFELLEQRGLLEKCTCGTNIRQGYKPCPKCNGAGHCNTLAFHDYMSEMKAQSMGDEQPEDV